MGRFCRFCGEQKDNVYNISDLNSSIINWLHKIVDLEDNNLPKKLCYSCFCTIEDINFFLEKCIKTYNNFKNNFLEETENNEIHFKVEVETKGLKDGTENNEIQFKLELEEKEEMKEEYLLDNESNIDENGEWLENEENFESLKQIETNKEELDDESKNLFGCALCLEVFSTNKEKSIHSLIHINDSKTYNYKCRFCEFQCNDKEKIAYHMKRDHLNNNKNALFKDLLAIVIDQRKAVKNEEDIAKCITNDNTQELNEINDIIIDETSHFMCQENTENKLNNNIDYIKLLNLADVYECKICNINFSKKTSFNKHWDALHLSEEEKQLKKQKSKSRDQFLCTECGKSLPSAFKLEYHIRMHKNDRQYKCKLCPKSYVSKSHLETHMYRHTGSDVLKMYSCEICEKKCRTPSELKIHQRFHRNERPFKCDYCQRSFYLKSHLQSHVKGHLNERTYICEEPGCTHSYRDKNAFRRHKDSHLPDDEKSYECDICKNKFSTFGIMKDHRRKSHSRKHKQNPLNENNFINNIKSK